jgi:hypothetical protein
MRWSSFITDNLYRPGLNSFHFSTGYDKLLKPKYRKRSDWPTGEIFAFGASYTYHNTTSYSYPVSGYNFDLKISKTTKLLDADWDYEKLNTSLEYYRIMPLLTVLATRLNYGYIWGFAPLQHQFDLAGDALFGTESKYDKTGRSIFSFNTELRIRKRVPLFDVALFSRNAWIKPYGLRCRQYNEAGVGLRFRDNGSFAMSLDFTLWKRSIDGWGDKTFGVQFKIGRPFSYSSMRWDD